MKKFTLIFTLICSLTFGQDLQVVNLIEVDNSWGKEIIQVPFWFAPEINYEGYEDIRFAKGWEQLDSLGFWTLAFAWDINLKTKPTKKFFEDSIKSYFDGLMKVVNEDKKIIIPKTTALFIETKTNKETTTFTGIVETYDAFTTKKMILLHVVIESYYCDEIKKYVPLFKLSPKNFNHKTWKMLEQVKLRDTICEN